MRRFKDGIFCEEIKVINPLAHIFNSQLIDSCFFKFQKLYIKAISNRCISSEANLGRGMLIRIIGGCGMYFIKMKKGQKFILQIFNGKIIPDEECDENENYWKLIEEAGIVINSADDLGFLDKNRVLFQFDCDVKARGLECHNEKPNSLWILKTDLKEIK